MPILQHSTQKLLPPLEEIESLLLETSIIADSPSEPSPDLTYPRGREARIDFNKGW